MFIESIKDSNNQSVQNVKGIVAPQKPLASEQQPPPPGMPPPFKQDPPQSQEKYLIAIDLKLLGYRYEIISKRLKKAGIRIEAQTIGTWFMKGGACHDKYEAAKALRVEQLKKDIDEQKNQLQEATVDGLAIIRTSLAKALEDGTINERDEANARDILDRGGLPKQNKTDFSGNIESESMKEMASAIKGVLEQTIAKTNQT